MTRPEAMSARRYAFHNYVDVRRMETYWHQLDACLGLNPTSMLEVGTGPGLVVAYLARLGIDVTTIDINAELEPDVVGSVLNLAESLGPSRPYDLVLCARVLHHIPFAEFTTAIMQLSEIAKHAVISVAREDFAVYIRGRVTSRPWTTLRLGLPLWLKRLIGRGARKRRESDTTLWKIDDSSETQLGRVEQAISKGFRIVESTPLPGDHAHHLFVLRSTARERG